VKKIFDKIGWAGLIVIVTFIGIFVYGKIRQSNLNDNAVYIQGTSLGIDEGAYGHLYLYYSFVVNNVKYKGHATNDFCKICTNCCEKGDTVIVKFQRDNPENSALVSELPKGVSLENNR
jgi:hypothetical protein